MVIRDMKTTTKATHDLCILNFTPFQPTQIAATIHHNVTMSTDSYIITRAQLVSECKQLSIIQKECSLKAYGSCNDREQQRKIRSLHIIEG